MKKSLLIASLMAVAAMSLSACGNPKTSTLTAAADNEKSNASPSAAGAMASDPPMSDLLKTRPKARLVASI